MVLLTHCFLDPPIVFDVNWTGNLLAPAREAVLRYAQHIFAERSLFWPYADSFFTRSAGDPFAMQIQRRTSLKCAIGVDKPTYQS